MAQVGLFTERIHQGFHRVDILVGALLRMSVVSMAVRLNLDCMRCLFHLDGVCVLVLDAIS
jgi:hypothetical protein